MCAEREANSTSEIEITPEMIEAGLPALWEYDPRFSNERDVIAEVFRAMMRAHLLSQRIS